MSQNKANYACDNCKAPMHTPNNCCTLESTRDRTVHYFTISCQVFDVLDQPQPPENVDERIRPILASRTTTLCASCVAALARCALNNAANGIIYPRPDPTA